MRQFISKQNLISWLRQQMEARQLVAPTQVDDLILFRRIDRVDDVILQFQNTATSPKEWLFPKTETLFHVERKDGKAELIPAEIDGETVIFGLRPCDARGITMLDLPYLADPADTLYRQHRQKTVLVGLSCLTACPECFCESMGSGPEDTAALDIMFTEVRDGYLVQAITEKGRSLMPQALLSPAETVKPPAPETAPVPSEGITAKMRQAFDGPYWGRVADRCIHCNVCAYVCPTCYCFDVRDYTNKGSVERVRSWESCQSPGFTKIAGGHDPRANKGARMRQRFSHKLLYFPEQFGPLHCVGCGRCVRACPVNIDIREIMQDVQRMGAPK
ncbi:MAG: sulfite reductase [Chloroflexi bacterium]|nr:sulfite reductase [Chloroflexota bacterium]